MLLRQVESDKQPSARPSPARQAKFKDGEVIGFL
jgi:hypothetical protein